MDQQPFEPVQFGRYQLIERLAKGGMAEIFKAKSHGAHGFEKTLVVKRILPRLAQDPEFVEMFIDEAKVMVQINHPKVVQVLDFGEVEGQYFIAMEYVQGVDGLALLRMCVKQGLRPKAAIAVHMIAEVLDALHYAHTLKDEAGRPLQIIHRDISPSNIFISEQGEVKLGDFGIARTGMPATSHDSSNLKGKYGYLAPEMITDGDPDQRSDIFSAGVVLAELLMVRRLFVAGSDLDVLLKVRDANLERLDKYGTHLPPDLRQVLGSALERNPELRYQDAASFRDALHRYLYDHRLMVRHTDVRRFLRRLRGEQEETARPDLGRLLPGGAGEEEGSGEREALETGAATNTHFPGPPHTGEGRAVASAEDAGSPDEEQAAGDSAEEPAADDPARAPLLGLRRPRPPSSHGPPPLTPPRPAVNTEYSSATRERIEIRPGRPPASGRSRTPAQPHTPVHAKERPFAPGRRQPTAPTPRQGSGTVGPGRSGPVATPRASASPFQRVGRKRKIPLGPPPRPRPVPGQGSFTPDRAVAVVDPVDETLGDAGSLGNEVSWDRTSDKSIDMLLAAHLSEEEPDTTAGDVARHRVSSKRPSLITQSVADFTGSFRETSPVALLFRLAMDEETGLLTLRVSETVKEVYFVDGDPRYVASNRPEELFGQYLVRKGVITKGELSMALAMKPHFDNKLGRTLKGLKLLRPVQVIRHLTQQVREMLLDAFSRDEGSFRFYRGRRCEQESAPLGLNAFEVIGAVAETYPEPLVQRRLQPVLTRPLQPTDPAPVPPEVFRLGSRPRDLYSKLDGQRSLAELLRPHDHPEQALALSRMLFLLLETGLVKPGPG